MPPIVARVWLAIMALSCIGIGLWGLFDPVGILASMGLEMTGIGATVEVRAMYGGLQLGLAAPMIAGIVSPTYRRPALLLAAFYVAGLGFGRIVGLGLVNSTRVFWGLAGLEGAMSVISAMIWALTFEEGEGPGETDEPAPTS